MSYEVATANAIKVTMVAGADLSTHQYKFVKMSAANTVVLCSAITDKPIGILQNDPKSGQEAEITVIGGSKLVTAAAMAVDAVVATDAAALGKTVAPGTDTTAYAVGRCLTATTAANGIASVLINCLSGRAA